MSTTTKVKIGEKSKVRLLWKTTPYDYSADKEKDLKAKFAKKYKISKDNIKVEPKFYTVAEDGSEAEFTNENSKNIHKKEFQHKLFKKYLDMKGVTDYDFDSILKIDEVVNSKIDYEVFDQNHKYSFKWIRWSNFMSYGKDNFFDFTKLKGLILLTSQPANQGGKTTFCLDLFRFLLFGKVTSRENDWKLERVFNRFLPDETEVVVEGCISIEGEDYVIKRTLTRPAKGKRTDKSKVTNKVKYYRIVSGEYSELIDEENEEGVSNTDTNKIIKEAIGNDEDFDLMISVNQDNLKKLISLKDTERGLFISRWLGLYILEKKCEIAKAEYSMYKANSLRSRFDRHTLQADNEALEEENKKMEVSLKELTKKIKALEKDIKKAQDEKELLLSSKEKLNDSLNGVDVETVKKKKEQLINDGKNKAAQREELEKEYKSITVPEFDKNVLNDKRQELSEKQTKTGYLRSEYKRLAEKKETLKNGEYCPTCHQKLAAVDNSKAIKETEEEIQKVITDGKALSTEVETLTTEIKKLEETEAIYVQKMKIETMIAGLDVNIKALRQEYMECKALIDSFKANEEAIRKNNEIDSKIRVLTETINAYTYTEKQATTDKNYTENNIKINKEGIASNAKIIEQLKKEEKEFYSWDLYLELVGKNGISKMIVREMLPIINNEMKMLLSDVCDFDVEIAMNDKNDVMFYIIQNGVKSNLGSGSGFEQTVASLALRSVLSKYSSFSKPSFVIFDEILGGVADENYEQVKTLYDKIVKDYQQVFQITHLKALADWHDYKICITKDKNISKISEI